MKGTGEGLNVKGLCIKGICGIDLNSKDSGSKDSKHFRMLETGAAEDLPYMFLNIAPWLMKSRREHNIEREE